MGEPGSSLQSEGVGTLGERRAYGVKERVVLEWLGLKNLEHGGAVIQEYDKERRLQIGVGRYGDAAQSIEDGDEVGLLGNGIQLAGIG